MYVRTSFRGVKTYKSGKKKHTHTHTKKKKKKKNVGVEMSVVTIQKS